MNSPFTDVENQSLDCTPRVGRNALMMRFGRKKIHGHGQLSVDRISELSDDILHHIISFLDTKEACRTCVLSKRWTGIWSTGLILDIKTENFGIKKIGEFEREFDVGNCTEDLERFKEFIDATMQRYWMKNLCVRKFALEYPIVDEMDEKIDVWLEIAVHNRLETLSLSITTDDAPFVYVLPDVFFAAKSLLSVEFCRVSIRHCRSLQLMSLQSLNLSKVEVYERTLQDIFTSCPLRNLKMHECYGFQNMLIPQCSNLGLFDVYESLPVGGTITVNTSSLRVIDYEGIGDDKTTWSFAFKLGSMRNLRELRIRCVQIEKYVFEQLVVELVSIEIMWLSFCTLPEKIKVSSKTLKEFALDDHAQLISVEIDAPELKTFSYTGLTGDLELSSVICSHGDAYLHLEIWLNTREFVRLRKLLSKVERCKVLELVNVGLSSQVIFDRDQVSETQDGMTPDVPELKVNVFASVPSQVAVLLDGLFWSCRPEILSLVIPYDYHNSRNVKYFLEALEEKVTCWKHPLKGIEVEGTDSSAVLVTKKLVLRLRLHW